VFKSCLMSTAHRYAIAGLVTLLLVPPVIRDAQALSLSVATNWAVMASKADGDQDEVTAAASAAAECYNRLTSIKLVSCLQQPSSLFCTPAKRRSRSRRTRSRMAANMRALHPWRCCHSSARLALHSPAWLQLVQEYRLYEALEKTVFALPARISWGLHTARGVLRFATINAAFAITNNLAASLTLSVLSNLFILAYNQQGRKELGLRSNATGIAQDGNRRPPSLKWPPDNKQDRDKQ
jgi:hypothetical protein